MGRGEGAWRRFRSMVGLSRLHVKAVRDLAASFWQFFACWLIVVLGTASYVALDTSYQDLHSSVEESYRRLHFADFSVRMSSAPADVLAHLQKLPGVGTVYGRISSEIELWQGRGGEHRKVIGRVIGMPAYGRPPVNDLVVVEGTWLSPGESHQVLLERSFARYHGYHPGSVIWTEDAGGHRERFQIVGLASSPEYIWVVRDREYLMPSPSTFGVLFMPEAEASRITGLGGRINEVQVTMADPARTTLAMAQSKQMLDPYGAEDPESRAKQPSNELLQQDLAGFKKMAVYFPSLFLALACLTIVSLLNRIIISQRPQIGILMALGLRPSEIVLHYLTFAVALGLTGGIGGCLLGQWLGMASTRLYVSALGVPYLLVRTHWDSLLTGGGVGFLVPLLAGLMATRSVLRIEPAAALYSEVATQGRKPWIEKLVPALSRLSLFWKMPLRNLFRKPARTLYTSMGVAIAIGQVMLTLALFDSRQAALDMFFHQILAYDTRVVYLQPRSDEVVQQIRRWPGVLAAEPALELPVKIRHGEATHSTLLFGLDRGGTMVDLFDEHLGRIGPTSDGLLVGAGVLKKLHASLGQTVEATLPHRSGGRHERDRWQSFAISQVMRQPIGSVVYLPLEDVRRRFSAQQNFPPRAINSVMLRTDPRCVDGVMEHLYRLSGAAAVERIPLITKEITDLLKMFNTYIYTMVLFATGLGFAIIFNSITLGILERTREIAAMRTLGRSSRSIVSMIAMENLILWAVGVTAGLPLGYGLSAWFVSLYQTDFATFTLVVSNGTYWSVAVGSLLVTLLAQIPAIRYVLRMDLTSMTRERIS